VKKQLLLTAGGLVVLLLLFFFGRIDTKKELTKEPVTPEFNINSFIFKAKASLPPSRNVFVSDIENSIKRGDVKEQQVHQYEQLADFWKDSVKAFIPYSYYLSEAAKLDNSEKKLTFAARLLLDSMKREDNPTVKTWEAERSAELFEKAIALDPDNDDLKVGLGSCYVYGKGMIGDAQETMKGIQQLLQVVRKDSGNMSAQLVLGVGGVISKQFDKAIERLNKVVAFDNTNLEAITWLADAYAGKGDKENAIKWYEYSKKLVNNPQYSKAVDERIKELQ
jgi:tetratricopeptide (TPR) repeat protein